MGELMQIKDYAWTTAKIIGSVLEKEVVICDCDLHIVGDSKYENYESVARHFVTNDAILKSAMESREILTINNVKQQAEGCCTCENVGTCDINSIIALPIIRVQNVIGCIGLYSKDTEFPEEAQEGRGFLIDFIGKMSELLISKLDEKNENVELRALQKRLSSIIEHFDTAVVNIDAGGDMIHSNSQFREMFGLGQSSGGLVQKTPPFARYTEFLELLSENKPDVEKELQFTVGRKKINVMAAINHIKIDAVPAGTMVYFRNTSKLYEEINRAGGSFAEVTFRDVIGESQVIRELLAKAEIFSKSSSTVLIQGESGTGKEIFSRGIHSASKRHAGPFVVVNCAAIPDNLLESELFGYEEGAFTGAVKGGRIGKFQLANNGTLFLDEVGELPLHLQVKILRTIQERKVQKIGSFKDVEIDIRIIAATNKDLEKMIESGEFREDLFYRLNVIPVTLPPLRERKSDIPILLSYFLKQYNQVLGKQIEGLTKEAMRIFMTYDWPGNIRELQNTVEYCVNMSTGVLIQRDELPMRITQEKVALQPEQIRPLKEVEQDYIEGAVRAFGDTFSGKEKAASVLGIGIATLYRKMKRK